jgi:signal transduction histidine kinase/ligand-binding sensor domain-containing protein
MHGCVGGWHKPGGVAAALRRCLTLLVLALIAMPTVRAAAHPFLDLDVSQFQHTAWTVKQGAPGQVTALAQSADGYLWCATQSGVFRFDGVSFERVSPGVPFPTENASALLAASDGSLWIGFRYGVVSHLAGDSVRHYDDEDGLPTGSVFALAQDHDGIVWAATWQGLARFDGQRWRIAGADWSYPGERGHTVMVDRDGTVWAASDHALAMLPRGARRFTALHMPIGRVSRIVQAPDGRLWIAESDGGVRPVVHDGETAAATGIGTPAFGLVFDRHGSLWTATLGEGIARVTRPDQAMTTQRYTREQGLSSDYLRAVIEDREGNLWFGSSLGIDRLRRSNVIAAPVPAGGIEFNVAADAAGTLWVGSRNRPLMRIANNQLQSSDGPAGITASLRDGERVLFGGQSGIWTLQQGRVQQLAALPADVGNSGVQAMAVDEAGAIWTSLNVPGLYRWQDGQWSHVLDASFPTRASPLILLAEPDGVLWMGFARNRVVRRQGDSSVMYSTEQGLDVGNVTALAHCLTGLCIGGERGLAYHDGSGVHTLVAGEGSQLHGITGLVEDRRGDLWVHGAMGVVRVPAASLRTAAAGGALESLQRLDHLDGLVSAPSQLRPLHSAVLADDGRVVFAQISGVAWIDPEQVLRNPLPPSVQIRSISAQGQRWSPAELPQLPPRADALTIDYSAASLGMPERVRFRYLLDGVDANWQDAGTRRQAIYTRLAPGDYRFRVMAQNEDGVWSDEGAELRFGIAPHFYQTHWFVLACLGVAFIVLRGLFALRLAQERARLRSRLRERHRERERIARELHDTLLQGFQGLILRFQAIGNRLPKEDALRGTIEQVLDRAEDTLIEGRERVRNLRDRRQSPDLTAAIEQIVERLDGLERVEFRIRIEGTPRALAPAVQEELLCIVREAVINALRHAVAQSIQVEIVYSWRSLVVTVGDDGRGMSGERLAQLPSAGRYGLQGMRERAANMGGRLDLISRAEAGTAVVLTLRASRAYRRLSRWRWWRLGG